MSTITYLTPSGEPQTVEAPDGMSVMRAAITNGIRGIIGECGGQAMCATCHVYVRESSDPLPPVSADEDEMLECTASERLEASRLSCQLHSGDFASIAVELPATQV